MPVSHLDAGDSILWVGREWDCISRDGMLSRYIHIIMGFELSVSLYCCYERALCKINLFKFIPNLLNVELPMCEISGEIRVELTLIQFI